MRGRVILPRVNREETTFAVVEWAGDFLPSELLKRVKRAVSRWVANTPEGMAALEDSDKDFNVGDLSNCDSDPTLIPYLQAEGLTFLDVNCFSYDGPAYGWEYDTVLADR
jgi:hypothetical protein